jgi:four helix bundle protein
LVISPLSLVSEMVPLKSPNKGFENLRVYQLSEKLSDSIWKIARGWDQLAKDTIGRQLIRAADSIGANIAEGTGRGSFQDNRRFVRNARGSLYETRHWLRRAHARRLLSVEEVKAVKPILDELGPKLNAYLRSIGPVLEPQKNAGTVALITAKDK